MPCRSETKCARPGCEPVCGRHERHDVRARYASRTDARLGQGSTKIRGVKWRDRLPSEGRAGVRGRRLDVQPSMSGSAARPNCGRTSAPSLEISLKKGNRSATSPGPSMSMSQRSIAVSTTRRPYEGTDNIRVEMHGKDRGIDARRPFAAGWLYPDRLRASSVRAMARRISVSPRRSPRAVVGVRHRRTRPGAVESNAGMVCKEKRPLSPISLAKVELQRQDHRSLQALPLRFHRHKGFGACPLPCISTRMLSVPCLGQQRNDQAREGPGVNGGLQQTNVLLEVLSGPVIFRFSKKCDRRELGTGITTIGRQVGQKQRHAHR